MRDRTQPPTATRRSAIASPWLHRIAIILLAVAAGAAAQPPAAAPQRAASDSQAELLPWESWSEVRLDSEGRSVVLARERAHALAGLVNQLARSATSTSPLATTPTVRIELSRRGVLLGILELNGDQARWEAVTEPRGGRTVRPDPAVMQSLREEVQRLLPS